MANKIKSALDELRAGEKLKSSTLSYISSYDGQANHNLLKSKNPKPRAKRLVLAFSCFAMAVGFILGGAFSYTTAIASISLDINPSLELDINLYNKVISAKGYNEKGEKLAREAELMNLDYIDAINNIMESETVDSLTKNGGNMEITVTSSSDKRNDKIKSSIDLETKIADENIYCSCDHREQKRAHSHGLSHGRYRAYLSLKEDNPSITLDEVREMNMEEIHRLKNCQSNTNCIEEGHSHHQSHHRHKNCN